MKEKIEVANPYNEEHINMFKEYEQNYRPSNSTYGNLLQTRNMLSESEYKKLEQERPEIVKTLFTSINGRITSVAHLTGEKDLRRCRIIIDSATNKKAQERLLTEAENYAFTNLKMAEVAVLQGSENSISPSHFKQHGFDDLGTVSGMQVYTKSKEAEKIESYHM